MRTLPVYRSGVVVAQTLVDDEDWERWRAYRFTFASQLGYAATNVDGRRQYLHRLVMGLGLGEGEVDHVNRDPLDNQRSNLRLATHRENCLNRRGRAHDPALVAKVLALRGEGASVRRIAAVVGCPKSTVQDWLRSAA